MRAALVTAMIRALVEELKPLARDPGMFLRKLNSDLFTILKTTGSPMLTTAFYLVANWRTGVMRFANAGHPKPLLVRRSAGRIEPLVNASGKSQPALGLFEDPPYQTTEINLAPGDFVMLFTDGLYEVQGPNEELYSQERLIMDVKDRLPKPAGAIVRRTAGGHRQLLRGPRIRRRRLPRRDGIHRQADAEGIVRRIFRTIWRSTPNRRRPGSRCPAGSAQ